jgi:hypothetical protein
VRTERKLKADDNISTDLHEFAILVVFVDVFFVRKFNNGQL